MFQIQIRADLWSIEMNILALWTTKTSSSSTRCGVKQWGWSVPGQSQEGLSIMAAWLAVGKKRTRFEYDTQKNQSNIRKHGLSFETASSAFNDPAAVIIYDEDHSTTEERYNLIGAVEGGILFIVYTMRDETIRMISARPATKREKERYYKREG